MLIGIAGTIGSGKGTIVKYLKERGFVHYSVSGFLGELVLAEGNPRTRNFLSPMATKLQKEYPGGVVEKIFKEKFSKENPKLAIIESIHRKSEVEFLQSVGALIIGVDADLTTRYERTKLRNESEKDQVDFEEFKKQADIEDEGKGDVSRDNNIRAVLEMADYMIKNNGTIEALHTQVDRVLEDIAQS